jgi:hypothetical protein
VLAVDLLADREQPLVQHVDLLVIAATRVRFDQQPDRGVDLPRFAAVLPLVARQHVVVVMDRRRVLADPVQQRRERDLSSPRVHRVVAGQLALRLVQPARHPRLRERVVCGFIQLELGGELVDLGIGVGIRAGARREPEHDRDHGQASTPHARFISRDFSADVASRSRWLISARTW